MIRRPPRSTLDRSSAASDVYKRQGLDHDFANLVLDEQRIPSKLLLFRLAESVNAIIVHEKIKKTIEAQGIEGMVFYGSGEWSG